MPDLKFPRLFVSKRNLEADKLRMGTNIAQLGLGEVDYLADTITLDERAAEFFDLPANSPLARPTLHDRIHPDDRETVERNVDALLSGLSDDVIDLTHRVITPDGHVRWLNARKTVVYDDDESASMIVQGLVVIRDVTQAKESEQQIQDLMGEIAHRSKNLLMVVSGIARMTSRHSKPEDFLSSFLARLNALSSNQAVLINDQWASIHLDELIRRHIEPFAPSQSGRIKLSGQSLKISERAAQAIGMAVHELATNAVKYGALSDNLGKVEISWTHDLSSSEDFTMTWQESGGPRVVKPTRTGFGDKVIRQMAASTLMGQVDLTYDPDGVMWRLTAPTTAVLVSA